MIWYNKTFEQLSHRELFEIYKIRTAIFVVEQCCAYQEVDDNDLISHHLFAKHLQELIAYCRVIPLEEKIHIGRVLVKPSVRGKGLAKALM